MAHTRSTRARLTLYFTAVFGVMVVTLATASYLVFRHEALSDLDSRLNVAASATAISAAHELAEHEKQADGESDLQSILDVSARASLSDTEILIRQGDRNVAHKAVINPGFDLSAIPTQRLLPPSRIAGMRTAMRKLQAPQFHCAYQIFAFGSVEPTLSKLKNFREILFVCVPLGLALAALAGYLLAHRTLAPLNELINTIEAITWSDLSARVKLNHPSRDFAWLASRFNSLLDRLEIGFHLQRQFMADASHELRTPLTVALSATQVTARDKSCTPADFNETLSLVEEQILRLRKIVDNMLFLSQVDAASLQLERREFYLDDAISEAARAARALARTKHQTLRISELPEAHALGDEHLFKQAVLILLDNAVKYAPAGGEITLALTAGSTNWRCRIWNNGPAIPPEMQSRIFERFFRAPGGTKEKIPGSGLGLPIARSIAETHGGTLTLIHSDSSGTAFELALPLWPAPAEEARCGPKSLAVKI